MRRILMLLVSIMLMACVIVLPASAENMAALVESYATVTQEGDCMVSTTVRLHLDSPVADLSFPVPLDATDVILNGGSARTTKTDISLEVDVSRVAGGMAGDITFALNYNLPGAVQAIITEENGVRKVNKDFLLHDFRMTKGETNINLIFDLVLPADCELCEEEAENAVAEKIREKRPNCFCVIRAEHPFV